LAASKSLKKHCFLKHIHKKGAAKLRREGAQKEVQKQQKNITFCEYLEAQKVHFSIWAS